MKHNQTAVRVCVESAAKMEQIHINPIVTY